MIVLSKALANKGELDLGTEGPNDAEIGRLTRERNQKKRELSALETRVLNFVGGIRAHEGKLCHPAAAPKRVGHTLLFEGGVDQGGFDIEWLDADEIEEVLSDMVRLPREIRNLEGQLRQLDIC